MNLFFLALSVSTCAEMYCNKHVSKMIVELAQMLSTAHRVAGGDHPMLYRKTHVNHPMAIWVRTCRANYVYTVNLGMALCEEYYDRYGHTKGRQHATLERLQWLKDHYPRSWIAEAVPTKTKVKPKKTRFATLGLPEGCTPVPLCFGNHEECYGDDLVESYRKFYKASKASFAKWPEGREPDWWVSS